MNRGLDSALRATLEAVADAPPPPGMAEKARRMAHRQRVTRWALGGVAAAVVAALVVVNAGAMVVSRSGGSDSPPAAPNPIGAPGPTDPTDAPGLTGARYVIEGYSDTAHNQANDESFLLNPATGGYDKVPYRTVVPSPDGRQVAVCGGDNSHLVMVRAGVMDRATGKVRWIGRDVSSPGIWSPDGRRILFTEIPKEGPSGFSIVDASTLRTQFVAVPDASSIGAPFVWAPDGNGVALTLSHTSGREDRPDTITGIRIYDLSGKRVRDIPESVGQLFNTADFSPDGRRVALSPPAAMTDEKQISIVDTASGTVQKRLSLPAVSSRVVGWYDEDHLIVRLWGAEQGGAALVVVDLDGVVQQTVPLFDPGIGAQSLYVGSADGLSGAAADLAF